MNGVPLPVDAPSVAEVLTSAGYRTALIGKAHFEPFLDPFLRFAENALASTGTRPTGRHPPGVRTPGVGHPRGHRAAPLRPLAGPEHPEAVGGFYPALDGVPPGQRAGGGDTGAPQVKVNPSTAGSTTPTGWPTGPSPGWTPSSMTTTGSVG